MNSSAEASDGGAASSRSPSLRDRATKPAAAIAPTSDGEQQRRPTRAAAAAAPPGRGRSPTGEQHSRLGPRPSAGARAAIPSKMFSSSWAWISTPGHPLGHRRRLVVRQSPSAVTPISTSLRCEAGRHRPCPRARRRPTRSARDRAGRSGPARCRPARWERRNRRPPTASTPARADPHARRRHRRRATRSISSAERRHHASPTRGQQRHAADHAPLGVDAEAGRGPGAARSISSTLCSVASKRRHEAARDRRRSVRTGAVTDSVRRPPARALEPGDAEHRPAAARSAAARTVSLPGSCESRCARSASMPATIAGTGRARAGRAPGIRMSIPMAAGRAAATALTSRASQVRGHGHCPCCRRLPRRSRR